MKIKHLICQNIRNYKYIDLAINHSLIIFVGNNGQGKTTLLECIYMASLSKSFRSYHDLEMISFNEDKGYVSVSYEKENHIQNHIEIKIQKEKEILYNFTKINKRADLVGKLLVVLFTPDDLLMFKNSASVRRNFLNIELSKLDAIYIKEANKCHKLIKKRNIILKTYPCDRILLQVVTDQLIQSQLIVLKKRDAYMEKISNYAAKYYQLLTTHTNEILKLEYVPFIDEKQPTVESLNQLYMQYLDRDLKYKQTHQSINKDDIVATINGHFVNKYASQGQMRSVALAIKLATLDIIYELCHEYPILLLDDVLSEFDDQRINHLMTILDKNVQTFITTTTLTNFPSILIANAQVVAIENGSIT